MEGIHFLGHFLLQHKTRDRFEMPIIQTGHGRRSFSRGDLNGFVQEILGNIVYDHDILCRGNVAVNASFQEINKILVLGFGVGNQNSLDGIGHDLF